MLVSANFLGVLGGSQLDFMPKVKDCKSYKRENV